MFIVFRIRHLRFRTKFITVRKIIKASPAVLVIIDNLNILGSLLAPFTASKVFCNVKTDIKASIKLMNFKSLTSISSDLLDFLKLTDAEII